MGKHIQEDSYYGKQGFSAVRVGGQNYLVSENTDAVLDFILGYGISMQIIDNKLKIEATEPSFNVSQW